MSKIVDETFVAHIGGTIMFVGSKELCEAYRDKQTFNTSSWKIHNLEDYGQYQYEQGYDAGYDTANDENDF